MLYKAGKEQFDDVFRIMENSFPENERRPYAEQKELVENKDYKLYIYQENETSDIEGFIGLWKFRGLIFIEHIAVDDAKRG
ncbi:MAG: GNAT family N-acetyltransferase, partial [Ruminococcus sp.]